MKTTCLLFLAMSWAMLTHESVLYPRPWGGVSTGVAHTLLFMYAPHLGRAGVGWGADMKNDACATRESVLSRLPWIASAREGVPRSASSPAGAGRARGHSGPAPQKVTRPKPIPNSRQRSMPGNALHQPGSNKSIGAAKGGLIPNETFNNALVVRPPSVVRPTVPSFSKVRHRGPNPAVVGGSSPPLSSNTRAINGTRMNRKP